MLVRQSTLENICSMFAHVDEVSVIQCFDCWMSDGKGIRHVTVLLQQLLNVCFIGVTIKMSS